jgi:hypothetical protein
MYTNRNDLHKIGLMTRFPAEAIRPPNTSKISNSLSDPHLSKLYLYIQMMDSKYNTPRQLPSNEN